MIEIDELSSACHASENFWEDLLDCIEERKVIPVIGRELITVTVDGEEVPLCRAVAERLLARYRIARDSEVTLRPHQELNDAVSALKKRGTPVQDLYSQINRIQREVTHESAAPEALEDLSRIAHFDLFITTTSDDLLINTLDRIREDGAGTDKIVYAPNLPGSLRRDIPELRQPGYRAVFYLFGEASTSPVYAIHDEDTLEFLYSILTERGTLPERMIFEVRNRNLLLIGCNFSDWLSRFFIRLSNQMRLSSGERPKREFLVGEELSRNESLTMFLKRFSLNSRLYPSDARAFVKELRHRWDERHPGTDAPHRAKDPPRPSTGEIFVSYSHADIGAARTLSDGLDELGANIIWFDKDRLKPGDEWRKEIAAAIKRCKIFVALLSKNTATNVDGYFAEEWEAALNRKRFFPGSTFKIVPVLIDTDTAQALAHLPDIFEPYQFGRAPGGRMDDALKGELGAALRALRRGRAS